MPSKPSTLKEGSTFTVTLFRWNVPKDIFGTVTMQL